MQQVLTQLYLICVLTSHWDADLDLQWQNGDMWAQVGQQNELGS